MRRVLILCAALALLAPAAGAQMTGLYYHPASPVKGASGWTFDAPALLPNGSYASPALTFASDTNLGIYRFTADHLAFATASTLFVMGSNSIYPGTDAYHMLGLGSNRWHSVFVSHGTRGAPYTDLTESSATVIWDVTVAQGASFSANLIYTIKAADATDQQVRTARVNVSAVNKAGTTTCEVSSMDGTLASADTLDETEDGNAPELSAGTLTYDITCADTTDSFSISVNAVSSLTQTLLRAYSRWETITTDGTLTPGT